MADEKLEVPEKSKGDAAHTITKAGLSAIPVLGGPAAELFQNVVQPPLEKRRDEWMAQVGEKLQELENNGLNLDELQKNEQFISSVMYASQLALRTHQTEKLNALRNAVINVATGQAPEDAIQHMFLDFIDSLTELHLQILKVFQAPETPNNMSMGGLSHVLEHNIPELRGRRNIYDQFWRDLYSRGLVNTDGLHVTMTGNGLVQKRTSELGDAFLNYIAEPQ